MLTLLDHTAEADLLARLEAELADDRPRGRGDLVDYGEALRAGQVEAERIAALFEQETGRPSTQGYGVAALYGPDGRARLLVPFGNIVTDAGDEYIGGKTIVGVLPVNFAAPKAVVSGMKLGTGSTAIAKSGGTGLVLATYITGSNNPFDAGYPTLTAVGSRVGWNTRYLTTWGAGDVTNAAITEVVMANDAGTDATSTEANTYARALISSVNKTASDSLVIDWRWKHLGS